MSKEPDYKEDARVVAAMLAAAVLKTAEGGDSSMWKLVSCTCDNAFRECTMRQATNFSKDVMMYLSELLNPEKSEEREKESRVMATLALGAQADAVKVMKLAIQARDAKDDEGARDHVAAIKNIMEELRAFEATARILALQSRHYLDRLVARMDQSEHVSTVAQEFRKHLRQAMGDECDCDECQKRRKDDKDNKIIN
jgi:hypothetical protein